MVPLELALHVAGDALAKARVLGLDLAVGGQDLGQPVLGEPGPALEVLHGSRLGRGLQHGLGRLLRLAVALRPVGIVDGILVHGAPSGQIDGL